MNGWTVTALCLTALFVLDRAGKACLVARFFARPPAPSPAAAWPTVALIQPVTRGATHLAENLSARARLEYPGDIRHLVVCDRDDIASQTVCRMALPGIEPILAEPDIPGSPVASKVAKMAAGVAHLGDSDVVCFVDDDILLSPGALSTLVAPLYASTPAGATFGLACQVSWETRWEALMSGFVNANALIGYVPLTFLTPPYTITGHIFALRRSVLEDAGGMEGLARRFDDDHEIARRVRALGLPVEQTALVYRVANRLASFTDYCAQLRRWFVMPREAMVPYLTPREQAVSGLLSLGNLMPPVILLCALCVPEPVTFACVAIAFLAFLACYAGLETFYLPILTPARRLLLLPVVAFLTPLHVLFALLLPGDRILWRGQVYHARRGGGLQVEEK